MGAGDWSPDVPPAILFDRLLPVDSKHGWARQGTDLYETADGGNNWTKAASPTLAPEETVVKTQLAGDGVILVTSNGRVLEYSRSAGWTSLAPIPAHSSIYAVNFVGPTSAFAVTSYNELSAATDIRSQWVPAGNLTG